MQDSAPVDMLDGISTSPHRTSAGTRRPAGATRQQTKKAQQSRTSRSGHTHTKTVSPFLEFFRSPTTRRTTALTLILLAFVLLIVTINFIKSGSLDQSLVENNTIENIASSAEGVNNVGGAVGASIAHALMVDGLGIGAFVLVIYIGVLGLSLFGILRVRFWSFTFKCMFTAISLSIIFGLFTYNAETAFHWGGNHGRYVNQWLFHVSDALGAYAVSILLIGILTVIYFNQLHDFYANASGSIAAARERMAAAAAEGRRTSTECAEVPEQESTEIHPANPQPQIFNEPQPQAAEKESAPSIANTERQTTIGFTIDDLEDTPIYTDDQNNNVINEPVSQSPRPLDSGNTTNNNAMNSNGTTSEPVFEIDATTIGDNSDADSAPEAGSIEAALAQEPFCIRDELSHYRFPETKLLIDRPISVSVNKEEQEENKDLIVKTLQDYGIAIAHIKATIGPTVTLYEIKPAEGVRIVQIKRLEDDIALSLAALGIRIIAPIPGKGTIGIEVPNREPQTISMLSVISSQKFRECKMDLPMALGATINNDIFIEDLSRMPHLLVAGATGQGKSVGLNCIIASLLYKKHPGELKFVLIDPKMVEFSLYARLENHFLAKLPFEDDPIVTEASKALTTLASLCIEMDNRYDLLKDAGVRTVKEYNIKFSEHRLNPEKGHRYMPYIVVIVDEFADLIMTAGKDISTYIARIAQKARAVGIHMIIATQRPSTDVITGMIKANFPGRIAFRVAQMVDSKTILDQTGANRLIGRGDMLFSHNNKLERVQCAFIDTPEVDALVDFISCQTGYGSAYLLPEPQSESSAAPGSIDLSKRDDLFEDCARFICQNTTASTSMLQRRFSIGYNKAGKIIDQLEAAGIVGPPDGQRPRQVLMDSIGLENFLRTL